jgi:hypothetical protein
MDNDLIKLSQKLLYNVKLADETTNIVKNLAMFKETELANQLFNDDLKKAFWINIYNAFTQIKLIQRPDSYADKRIFFTSKQFVIATQNMSFDDIEHGILRHSKVKFSLGYITNPLASVFEKMHRVKKLDFRIHFCLNCGAVSFPPIAFYKPEIIDQQMAMATKNYLQNVCLFNEATNTVSIPLLLKWFKADFGTTKQIIQLLQDTGVLPRHKRPTILFTKYNWNLQLSHYTTIFKHEE